MFDKFVIEMPWLDNIVDADTLIKNFNYEKARFTEWEGIRWYNILSVPPPEIKLLKLLFDKSSWIQKPSFKIVHKPKGRWFKPHIDTTREVTIIIPDKTDEYKIRFLEDLEDLNSTIYEHTYTCPTLINGKIPHCVLDEKIDRKTIQVNIFMENFSWDKLCLLVKSHKLFK